MHTFVGNSLIQDIKKIKGKGEDPFMIYEAKLMKYERNHFLQMNFISLFWIYLWQTSYS